MPAPNKPAPKTAPKKPQDHLPAKTEATSQKITFEYEGGHYSLDRGNADNLELFEFAEDGEYIKAIRGYLGLDQWQKWKDSVREDGRVPSATFEPFLNAVMEAIGGSRDDVPN